MTTSHTSPYKLYTLLAFAGSALFFAGCAPDTQAPTGAEDVVIEDIVNPVPTPPSTDTMAAECGEKNTVCETSDDCCGAKGLECQDVRTSDGGFGKRCLPVEVMVCRSDCTDGVWGEKRNCKMMVPSTDMVRCEEFIGDDCKISVNDARNDRECQDT